MAQSQQTIAAVIAAVAGLAAALLSYLWKRRSDDKLARLNAQLTETQERRKAQRDYEYEARKRLYAELQPLFFQLAEASDNAYWRVHGLANSAREGRLTGPSSRLRSQSRNYLPSTVYRFMVPLVLLRLCQRRLTVVDLSLEPEIHHQYILARLYYRSWNAARALTESGSHPIRYEPYRGKPEVLAAYTDLPVTTRQHLNFQQIEQMVESLITEDRPTNLLRCMTYGEFVEAYRDEKSRVRRSCARIVRLFENFHPASKPVLWRILISQAHISKALGNASDKEPNSIVSPVDIITDEERKGLDWRSNDSETTFEEAVAGPFSAARYYLSERLNRLGYARRVKGE